MMLRKYARSTMKSIFSDEHTSITCHDDFEPYAFKSQQVVPDTMTEICPDSFSGGPLDIQVGIPEHRTSEPQS